MADRKQFVSVGHADEELSRLLEASRAKPVSEEDLHEQRISFAYGNAMNYDRITKESVRRSSQSIRLKSDES